MYYYVQDMERGVRFYRDVLGLRVTEQSDHWSALEIGGVRVGLHWTGGEPVPAVPRDPHGAKAGGTLTLRVDDVDREVARLRTAGTKILGEPAHNSWGSLASIEDPDGNVLKLMQPPRS
jgi:predicted enzyme related to lactoylglutathione lyase